MVKNQPTMWETWVQSLGWEDPLEEDMATHSSRRRLLRVPRITRRSNQSILKEISPEHSLEGLIQKQNLQYFGHQMQRATH